MMADAQAVSPDELGAALAALTRNSFGKLTAALYRSTGNFQLAEDSLQDALEAALTHWARTGLPKSPEGWLLQVGRRKAIDRIRREKSFERKSDDLARLIILDQEEMVMASPPPIADERLALVFTCCHPAIDRPVAVALTLRSVCGLTTTEIARAFVVSDEAMAQRLVRARRKISLAGIGFEIPTAEHWPVRLRAVLETIYLMFNEGYAATSGESAMRVPLCEKAIRLCRLINQLQPGNAEIEGLLALMLLTYGRAGARSRVDGRFIPLDQQDRRLWDRVMIDDGEALLTRALEKGQPGPFQLQAAIAACHDNAPDFASTDWQQIVLLYDGLHTMTGNPIYLLNRAVALSQFEPPEIALTIIEGLGEELAKYQPFQAARADLLRRCGRNQDAADAYRAAIKLSGNDSDHAFLETRLGELGLAEN